MIRLIERNPTTSCTGSSLIGVRLISYIYILQQHSHQHLHKSLKYINNKITINTQTKARLPYHTKHIKSSKSSPSPPTTPHTLPVLISLGDELFAAAITQDVMEWISQFVTLLHYFLFVFIFYCVLLVLLDFFLFRYLCLRNVV